MFFQDEPENLYLPLLWKYSRQPKVSLKTRVFSSVVKHSLQPVYVLQSFLQGMDCGADSGM